ncbi:MAG: late competence development ComFB family protein [Deferribacteres bacterium]|nr:late competence development ComFB family protein [Deferribacteres bacterium]
MGRKDIFGFDLSEINNINEELVIELMEEILNEDKSICRCHLCIEDIYALSLNNLPPLYVQSTFKDTTSQDNDLTRVLDREKVEKAVREATNKVNSNPYH